MDRPRHTLVLLPHGRGRSHRLRFTTAQAIAFGLVAAGLVVLASASLTIWSFRRVESEDLQRVQRENRALRDTNEAFVSELDQLETRLREFEQKTRELAIMSGLGTEEDATEQDGDRSAGAPAAVPQRGRLRELQERSGEIEWRLLRLERRVNEQLARLAAAPLATLLVEPGDFVRRGDPLGTSGRSGRTTGYHLHYEIRRGRDAVDPARYLISRTVRIADATGLSGTPTRLR